MENFIYDINSVYTIQDDNGNYLTCDSQGNLSLTTVVDESGNTQGWQTAATVGQTTLASQAVASNFLYSIGEDNADLMTGGVTSWNVEPDGSILSVDSNPLYVSGDLTTKKPVGSKTKQTWTWTKKLIKEGGWEKR